MAALTERLEVRLQRRALQLLRQEAERRRISLAEAVRQAINLWLAEDHQARQQAAEILFQVGAPVADWEQMKAEIIEGHVASETVFIDPSIPMYPAETPRRTRNASQENGARENRT